MAQENGTNGVTVKKEKVDHEIDVLAAEMAEKNRQKMASQASQIAQQTHASQQALQRAGGQQMITYYFNRDKANGTTVEQDDSIVPKKIEEKKKGNIDEDSARGRFGWTTIHTVDIPYLFRRDEKYCAVKMVELRLLNKYLGHLPQEITTCINVRSYFITEHEARLLIEINSKHCEFQFGREPFTTKDLVVKVSEATHFHRFLNTCFRKLVQRSTEPSEYCGFVRINGESVVPYTVKEKVKYVPLFYFEGETDTLKLKAEKIDNWELAYLKFCCKVQGIRNELFASDTCAVVSLDDVKQYFPRDTQFEDWWPQKTAEPMRVAGMHNPHKAPLSWTQRPSVQPPNPSPVYNSNQQSTKNQIPQQRQSSSHSITNKASNSMSQLSGMSNVVNSNSRSSNNAHHASASSSAAIASALAASAGGYNASQLNRMNMNDMNALWANAVATNFNGLGSLNGMNGINSSVAAAAAALSTYGSNPNLQSMLSSLNSEQMRRLGVSVPNLTPHSNNIAAALAVAQQQQHAAATASAARTLRSHTLSTSQANRTNTTLSSASAASKQASAQQQLVSQLNYTNYLNQQQAATLDNILTRNAAQHYASQSAAVPAHTNHKSISGGKAPPPLIPVSNGASAGKSSRSGGGIDKTKLVDVPPFRPDHSRGDMPYVARKIIVGTRQVRCINHTAYNHSSASMVALQDLITEFFPQTTLAVCVDVFSSLLSIIVYRANWHQVYTLKEAWGMDTSNSGADVVPLIFADDLIRSLSQMKYFFNRNPTGLTTHQAGPTSKRIRIS